MKNNQFNSLPFNFKNRVVVTKNSKLDESIKNIQFMFQNTEKIKSSEMILKELNQLKSKDSASPFGLEVKGSEGYGLQKSKAVAPLLTVLTKENINSHIQPNSLNTLHLMNILNKQNQKSKSLNETNNLNNQSLLPYLNSITQFNRNLANPRHVLYQFNKSNNKSYKLLFDKTSKLLKLTFLGMGCLISRPVYKVIYTINNLEFENNTSYQDFSRNFTQKVLIDLSYYIRKNRNKYLNNQVEVKDNIISISHLDSTNKISNTPLALQNSQDSQGLHNMSRVSQRNNILCKYNDKFQFLTDNLNSIFKSEIELDLVRLHKVFYDSNILVQDIALKSYKFRFVKLVSRLFKRLHIQNLDNSNHLNNALQPLAGSKGMSFPSYLSGVNIKLAGRTFRQRVVPRMTVKRIQKGSLTNVNVQFIDRARFTGKTRRGAFSFTITLGHVFK